MLLPKLINEVEPLEHDPRADLGISGGPSSRGECELRAMVSILGEVVKNVETLHLNF